MSIRVGTVKKQLVKRIKRNKDGSVRVQPVRKTGDWHLVHEGDAFNVLFKDFAPHKI